MAQDRQRRPGDGSKIAGAGAHILSREVHHWWPQGLSKFWADQNGLTSRLNASGEILRSPPKNFGAMKNAHAIKLQGPWNATVEPIFDFADSNLPRLVASILQQLRAGHMTPSPNGVNAYPMTSKDRDALSEGLASLVLRSPAFRNRIRLTINSHRADFGQSDVDERDNLIAGNIYQWYPTVVDDFRQAYIGLLYSHDTEFIFGEGYLNNISGQSHTSNLRAVVPLTPELAAVCFSGSGSIPSSAVCTFAITGKESSGINELTQIYTRDYVYFRSQRPAILDSFAQNKFLQREHHEDATVEPIISKIREAKLPTG